MLDKLFGLKSEQPKESAPDQGHVVEPVEVGETKPSKPERVAHLKEGVPAIMACVGTYEDFKNEMSREAHDFDIESIDEDEVDVVDWYEDADSLNKKNMKNAGTETYIISEVNEKDKFSGEYWNCMALVIVGRDAKTGEDVSILSHQSRSILRKDKGRFKDDLSARIQELESRCEPGTIDAVMTGGNYLPIETLSKIYQEHGEEITTEADRELVGAESKGIKENYTQLVQLVSGVVGDQLGFYPFIVAGPKTRNEGDAIFYDTDHRRLYLIRPESTKGSPANAGYHPRDIEEEAKKWDN